MSRVADDVYMLGFLELFDDLEGEALVFGGEVGEEVEELLGEAVFGGAADLVDDAPLGEAGGLVFAEGVFGPAGQVLGPDAKGCGQGFDDLFGGVVGVAALQVGDVRTVDIGSFGQGVLVHVEPPTF